MEVDTLQTPGAVAAVYLECAGSNGGTASTVITPNAEGTNLALVPDGLTPLLAEYLREQC